MEEGEEEDGDLGRDGGLCFHRGACNLQSALTNRRQGESSSPLMQVAIQEEPARPAGRQWRG